LWICDRCEHYRRRCRIRAPCCNEVFDCRHCHNEATVTLLENSLSWSWSYSLLIVVLSIWWRFVVFCFAVFVWLELVAQYIWSAWTGSTWCKAGTVLGIILLRCYGLEVLTWSVCCFGISGHLLSLWYRTASKCPFIWFWFFSWLVIYGIEYLMSFFISI